MKGFDVVIVGAGPAGLFAAYELAGRAKVALIDKGLRARQRRCPLIESELKHDLTPVRCAKCSPCHVMYGVGGAGALSSGTINLRPDVGGDLHKILGSWSKAEELIRYVDSVFVKFGAPKDRLYVGDPKALAELERLAARAGAKFIPTPQRHIGSDNTVEVIENMTGHIEGRGVKVITGVEVIDVIKSGNTFKLKTSAGEFTAKYVILAPGRGGASWFADLARARGVEVEPGPLDIGVRVEVPAYVMEPVTQVARDPKIVLHTKVYDDKVRTFCCNPNGFVVQERYWDGFVGVNGEAYASVRSRNTLRPPSNDQANEPPRRHYRLRQRRSLTNQQIRRRETPNPKARRSRGREEKHVGTHRKELGRTNPQERNARRHRDGPSA